MAIDMSVLYTPHYLGDRAGCIVYISHSGIAGSTSKYFRDRQLKGHSRGFETSLACIEYHPKSTIEAQPLQRSP